MEQEQIKNMKIEKEPIVYLNDKYLFGLGIVENGKLPENLKNCGYEKVFRIKTLEQLKVILADIEQQNKIKETIKQFGFVKSTCVFIFEKDFTVSLKLQQQMIDYQPKIFDDITVTHIRKQPKDLLLSLTYAQTKQKPIAVFTQLRYTSESITYVANKVLESKPIYKLKVKHIRLKNNLDKYRLVSSLFKDNTKKLHLVLCSKKVSIFDYENFAYEFLALQYGFRSFCENFREKKETKKKGKTRRFPLFGFNKENLFYEKTVGLGLQGQELKNIADVGSELKEAITKIEQNKLTEYIENKIEYRDILVKLEIV